ncbi:MAG: hypothetical protein ACI835_001890 [Planctomycetota bacterium]|jgi:hypothetical protein
MKVAQSHLGSLTTRPSLLYHERMSRKRVLLDSAEYLDSSDAAELQMQGLGDLRKQAELVFSICYEELGKRPERIDGQDMEAMLALHLPRRMKRRDPLAERMPDILGSILSHLEMSRGLPFAFETRMALNQGAEVFEQQVESGDLAGQRAGPRSAPEVNQAEKLGRNDPCFCGSGKKFKKCHGKSS